MKSVIYLFLLMVCFPPLIYGQVQDSTSSHKRKAIVYFSPDYSYRNLSSKNTNNDVMLYRDTVESAKLAFTTGINVLLYKKEKLSLWSGLSFSDKGERAKKVESDNPISQDVLPINFSYNNHYYYLGLPVKGDYTLLQKKGIEFFSTVGFSINYLLTQKMTISSEYASKLTEKRTVTINDNASKINLAGMVGLGIKQRLNEKATFIFTPLFTYSFNSVVKNAPLKSHFYSLGFNLALQFDW